MEDTVEQKTPDLKPLSSDQLRLVRIARARDQFNHAGTYRGETSPHDHELYEFSQKVGISVRTSDLIGWDEEQQKFTEGHDTEDRRRARGGRQLIVRGRGSFCILDDKTTDVGTLVLTFDNPNDKKFVSDHKDSLRDYFSTFYDPSQGETRTVILLGEMQISVQGLTG